MSSASRRDSDSTDAVPTFLAPEINSYGAGGADIQHSRRSQLLIAGTVARDGSCEFSPDTPAELTSAPPYKSTSFASELLTVNRQRNPLHLRRTDGKMSLTVGTSGDVSGASLTLRPFQNQDSNLYPTRMPAYTDVGSKRARVEQTGRNGIAQRAMFEIRAEAVGGLVGTAPSTYYQPETGVGLITQSKRH